MKQYCFEVLDLSSELLALFKEETQKNVFDAFKTGTKRRPSHIYNQRAELGFGRVYIPP